MTTMACGECLARRRLIGELSPLLDYQRARPDRLMDLLALPAADLIEAVAGRRRAELRSGLRDQTVSEDRPDGTWEICRHSPLYPRRALALPQPPLLAMRGQRERCMEMLAAPAVALAGSRAPSGYGVQMAASLGRGLSAAGVCVVASLDTTIGRAALSGTLRASGRAAAVLPHGLGVRLSGATRQLSELLPGQGCMVSEQPPHARGRSWGTLAAERLAVAMCDLLVVVEARAETSEMLAPRLAGALGRPLGAVPGMLTNPLASGPHALLSAGASLVRGPADVLDILHLDAATVAQPPLSGELRRELACLLREVGAGSGTIEELTGAGRSAGTVLAGLGEARLWVSCYGCQAGATRRPSPWDLRLGSRRGGVRAAGQTGDRPGCRQSSSAD